MPTTVDRLPGTLSPWRRHYYYQIFITFAKFSLVDLRAYASVNPCRGMAVLRAEENGSRRPRLRRDLATLSDFGFPPVECFCRPLQPLLL